MNNFRSLLGVVVALNALSLCHAQTSADTIKIQLDSILERDGFRHSGDTATLNAVAQYIEDEFENSGGSVRRQSYFVGDFEYHNIITNVGDSSKPMIVIGAHYDVCGNQKGADDNGTGVVGLLQAVDQLQDYTGDYYLEFVAYTLEEPPHYNTHNMGSYVHSKSLKEDSVDVHGMICLEMIGYFSDEKKSQSYPIGILKAIYGGKGDYITLVRKLNKGKLVRKFTKGFRKTKNIKTKKFTAPKSLTGVDFSDHRSYWQFGYDALMITDTAFYRNRNYHEPTDTVETIDFKRMAKVIDSLISGIKSI